MIRGCLISVRGICLLGERSGVALRLEDHRGHVGWGEATPLGGYSPDTLGDCATGLERALTRPLPEATGDVREAVEQISADLPAARFALESALLGVIARRDGARVAELLGAPASRIRRTTLWPADVPAALARGIRCFKLKVGRIKWDVELAIVRDLRETLGPDVAIRVDANAAWDASVARERIAELLPMAIDWIEQPTPTSELSRLGRPAIPLALDESLRDDLDDDVLEHASVFVLKPAVLGGAMRCLDLARDGRRRGIDSVVSHLYDGAIAMSAYVELALAIGDARPHGLDTNPFLEAMRIDR